MFDIMDLYCTHNKNKEGLLKYKTIHIWTLPFTNTADQAKEQF